MVLELDEGMLAELSDVAVEAGLLGLAAISIDDPRFAGARAALEHFVEQGRHGEMEFMARSKRARLDPRQMMPQAETLLVTAVPYAGDPGPIARYAQGADYHTIMHRRLEIVVRALEQRLPQIEAMICIDSKPIMERSAAALAGLGFLGKHGLLIIPGIGSYVVLGEILCSATWKPPPRGQPTRAWSWDVCGSCMRCIEACPTAAITQPGELDPRRCISYLTIEHRGPIEPSLADRIGTRVAGCDACQEVCPYNATTARPHRVRPNAWLERQESVRATELSDLVNLRSGRYRAFVRDSALRRIPRRQLRRNALLALGNRAGPLSTDERQAVQQAVTSDDEQIESAARRVLDRRK